MKTGSKSRTTKVPSVESVTNRYITTLKTLPRGERVKQVSALLRPLGIGIQEVIKELSSGKITI